MGFGVAIGLGNPPFPIIANILARWRMDLANVTLSAGNLSAIADISGGSISLSQATPGSQPPYNASDALFANQPSVALAAGKLITGTLTVPQPFTMYCVARQSLSAGGAEVFDGVTTRVAFGNNSTGYYLYAGGSVVNFAGLARDTNAHAFAATLNGASTVFYVDNSQTGQTVNPGGNSLVGPSIPGTFPGTGAVAEVVLYSGDHTSSQVQSMFGYFRRYGILTF